MSSKANVLNCRLLSIKKIVYRKNKSLSISWTEVTGILLHSSCKITSLKPRSLQRKVKQFQIPLSISKVKVAFREVFVTETVWNWHDGKIIDGKGLKIFIFVHSNHLVWFSKAKVQYFTVSGTPCVVWISSQPQSDQKAKLSYF